MSKATPGSEFSLVTPPGLRPALLAYLRTHISSPTTTPPAPLVIVTATGRDADETAAAVSAWLPAEQRAGVVVLPAWETLPHERLSPRADTVARRLAVLRRLAHPQLDAPTSAAADPLLPGASRGPVTVLVVPVRALLQPLVAGLGDLEPVQVRAGDTVDLDTLTKGLSGAAYARVDLVTERGQFAVRGGIIDVFPPTEPHPVRLELWGDQVEEIRYFSVADQRSLGEAEQGLWAPPCRELLLTPQVRQRAADLIPQVPAAGEILAKISEGIATEGMEALIPVLVDRLVPLTDLLPEQSFIALSDPERIRTRAHDLVATTQEFLAAAWSTAAGGGQTPIDLSAAAYLSLEAVRELAKQREMAWWTLTPFGLDVAEDQLIIPALEAPRFQGEIPKAIADLKTKLAAGLQVVVLTVGPGSAHRLHTQFNEADLPARLHLDNPDWTPAPDLVNITTGPPGPGFVLEAAGIVVVSENDLTGRAGGSSTKDMRAMPSRRRGSVDPLSLNPGDFVVHNSHGVGKFVELTQRKIRVTGEDGRPAEAVREYLVLEYSSSKRGAPADRLYVPTDQLDQISRYVGGETPALNKLGGADWKNAKNKARKAVREIAGELVRLYSERMTSKGHAFGPATPWQAELEQAFAYVETPDQLSTIEEVKADMEKPVPMDRLICGDVGYGKTEIAVRAAFKAVQDGKQVAVLVPTTLLVSQHLETFMERYAPFPVTVRGLSRFQSAKESNEIIAGLADGSVDVVIGTHRLITGQVFFKDLGLVIIDEEQRFGVEHKETLKALRTDVDVLSMSATPIPRTLEMAVTGIREMSTLDTPPEQRHPILTYVGPRENKQIGAAIRRELLRDGQVFFIHNRVESIDRVAKQLAELVPEARVAVAHGQMGEHQLELVIKQFWEREIDVLVCTTIVETGLDISNANTLILDRADRLGLSQRHQ